MRGGPPWDAEVHDVRGSVRVRRCTPSPTCSGAGVPGVSLESAPDRPPSSVWPSPTAGAGRRPPPRRPDQLTLPQAGTMVRTEHRVGLGTIPVTQKGR